MVLVAMLVQPALAQMPKAVVTGPKEAVSGDMVILDASQSTGQKYLWRLLENDKSFLPTDNNLRCVFAAGVDTVRTFHFILIAAGTNPNGSPEVDIATHDLVMKPRGAPPEPTPDPTPGPVTQKVARVLILHENDQDTAQFQKILQWIRSDKELSKKVTALDKDAKNPDESPNQVAQNALKFIGGNPLPRVLAVSSDGAFVKQVEFPKSEDDAAKLLKEWGLL
jgi:hypothetical protein